jgi:ketosteroid isomerase-like protein
VIGAGSSGRMLARLVAAVPATVDQATVRARVAAYYASYDTGDVAAREALFADTCRVEDPAGRVVATGRAELHGFFTATLPADWSIRFRLDRVAVVGDEALATTTMTLRIPQRTPVEVLVNAHFVFTAPGLVTSLRMFFDAAAMRDAGPDTT